MSERTRGARTPPGSRLAQLGSRPLHEAIERSSEAVFFLDEDHRVVALNPAFASFAGVPRDTLEGRELATLEIFDDDPELRRALDALAETGSFRGELMLGRGRGRQRIIALSLSSTDGAESSAQDAGPDGARTVGLLSDLTDLRRLESISLAINLSENLGQIFSGIRHELGNPINSIKTAFSVLQRNVDTFSPERTHQYFENIARELARVEDLLKSLRNFSAFEKPVVEPIHVAPFLDRLRLLTAADCEQRGVSLRVEPVADDVYALASRRALLQVVLNVLNNALDATLEETEPQISIATRRDGDQILLTIADNGLGFDPDEAGKLLQPFYTSKPQGSGLGLAICHKLLTSMRGSIHLEGHPGDGCLVTLSLPAAPRAETREAGARSRRRRRRRS